MLKQFHKGNATLFEWSNSPIVLFEELMNSIDMPSDLRNGIEELLEIKKMSDEKEQGMQIPVIHDFITDEIARQKAYIDSIADDRNRDWKELNDVFLNSFVMDFMS